MVGTSIFRNWSIKGLLQLWSVATLIAITVIALVALYANDFFLDTQEKLTEHVLPLESVSRQLSVSASLFLARQEQLVSSQSLDDIADLIPRQQLEEQFNFHWNHLDSIVSQIESGRDTSVSLNQHYQAFLSFDTKLFNTVEKRHQLSDLAIQQTLAISEIEQKIQNRVEAISGQINLNVSRYKRKFRQSLDELSNENNQNLIELTLFNYQDEIQN